MDIRIGRLSLGFPLDLVVYDALVIDYPDTILDVRQLTIEVQLLPLLKQQVEIDGVRLQQASVNTAELIEGMKLKGDLGELFLRSHGVALSPETAMVNDLQLKDTHLFLSLADTTAADTVVSEPTFWKIKLQRADLSNVSFAMDMPLDTMDFRVAFGEASLRNGFIDLHKSAYTVGRFRIKRGAAAVNMGNTPLDEEGGIDPSHLHSTILISELILFIIRGIISGHISVSLDLKNVRVGNRIDRRQAGDRRADHSGSFTGNPYSRFLSYV